MKLLKYELIKEIMEIEDQDTIITGYELITNHDIDYIPNLFDTKEDFEEFVEKGTPKKCCVKEEDND